jgi:predicted RNA-binding Zn-ribbon protein involved in translation (DUF1610 family)
MDETSSPRHPATPARGATTPAAPSDATPPDPSASPPLPVAPNLPGAGGRAAPADEAVDPRSILGAGPNDDEPAPDDEIDDGPEEHHVSADGRFPCEQCGADLRFRPGLQSLRCDYCGCVNELPASPEQVEELDFVKFAEKMADRAPTEEQQVVKCETCGAQPEVNDDITATECPFCGSGIVTQSMSRRLITPTALLPFAVERHDGRKLFRRWLKKLWFAPSSLTKSATIDQRLNGMYVPHWTFDSSTITVYSGRRGTRRTTGFGKNRRTYTSWRNVSGVVTVPFDDVLVRASYSLPNEQADKLEPWDLGNLQPYDDAYLAGFNAEAYTVDLTGGFTIATRVMDRQIREMVKRDIGGDRQQIRSLNTKHRRVTFKHILLPVWISAYRYNGKTYRFLINARTGEVQGERPWSVWKIALVLLIVAAIGAIALWYINHSGMVSSGGGATPGGATIQQMDDLHPRRPY